MTSKCTPGPWQIHGKAVFSNSKNIPDGRVFGYGFGDKGFICDLDDGEYHEYNDREEMEANGRLIAAAPDLREALEQAVREISAMNDTLETPVYDSDIKRWKAAIAKARGENFDD
jgi:hypothetical protein